MAEAKTPERDRRSLYLLDSEVARGKEELIGEFTQKAASRVAASRVAASRVALSRKGRCNESQLIHLRAP
jgi:hypothetical protein